MSADTYLGVHDADEGLPSGNALDLLAINRERARTHAEAQAERRARVAARITDAGERVADARVQALREPTGRRTELASGFRADVGHADGRMYTFEQARGIGAGSGTSVRHHPTYTPSSKAHREAAVRRHERRRYLSERALADLEARGL